MNRRPPYSPIDMDQMSEAPQRGSHHRRSHSETLFRFSDDFLFDVSDLDLSALDLPSNTVASAALMTGDSYRSDESSGEIKTTGTANRPPTPINHFRSLSVDADFFEGLAFAAPVLDAGGKSADAPAPAGGGRRMGLHRRNSSLDGSSSSFEGDSLMAGVKKALPPEKLAELALLDPKRAKKFLRTGNLLHVPRRGKYDILASWRRRCRIYRQKQQPCPLRSHYFRRLEGSRLLPFDAEQEWSMAGQRPTPFKRSRAFKFKELLKSFLMSFGGYQVSRARPPRKRIKQRRVLYSLCIFNRQLKLLVHSQLQVVDCLCTFNRDLENACAFSTEA